VLLGVVEVLVGVVVVAVGVVVVGVVEVLVGVVVVVVEGRRWAGSLLDPGRRGELGFRVPYCTGCPRAGPTSCGGVTFAAPGMNRAMATAAVPPASRDCPAFCV
jgi:hypothetical protein